MSRLIPLILVCLVWGCAPVARQPVPLAAAVDETRVSGLVADEPDIRQYVLRNTSGMEVRFLNYGGVITAILVPDRHGKRENVVVGYGSESEYRELNAKNYFGAIVGRYAGRIANARFVLDGREVWLNPNIGKHALHGGAEPGIAHKLWRVRTFHAGEVVGAELTLRDPAGSQGFPGALDLSVTYSLLPADSLRIEYRATTTEPTVLNLTNHTYFNLGGAGSGSVEDHRLRIVADRYLATDADDIPTGSLPPVAGTPLDFRTLRRVGDAIDSTSPPIPPGRGGYNHSWILKKPEGSMTLAAELADPNSGRTLTLETSEPALHVYTGDYFDGRDRDAKGRLILRRHGVALEAMHLGDSPNRPEFPSTVLRPGQRYRASTIWRFSLRK